MNTFPLKFLLLLFVLLLVFSGYKKNDHAGPSFQIGPQESLRHLTRMSALNPGLNKTVKTPSSNEQRKHLATINGHRNRLTDVPPVVGNVKRPAALDLAANPLTCLPQSVWDLNPQNFDWSKNNYARSISFYCLPDFGAMLCKDRLYSTAI